MLRELDSSEMSMVSGGHFHEVPAGTIGTLDGMMGSSFQTNFDSMIDALRGGSLTSEGGAGGGDEVIATGTQSRGFWGRVFDALDVNDDGDLYDEGALAGAVVGVALGAAAAAATAPFWITALGFSAAASFISGALSGYADANPESRPW